MKRPQMRVGIDTETLLGLLMKAEEGGTVTYAECSEAVGFDVQHNRGALSSARRIAIRDDGVVFEIVTNIGLRRCSESDKVRLQGAPIRRRIRSANRKGERIARAVDYEAISPEERGTLNTERTVRAIVEMSTKAATVKRLASKVQGEALPSAKAIKALLEMSE